MSPSSSASSSASSFGVSRRLTIPKSHIDIHLNNHFSSKTYTSGSPLSGHVSISTTRSDLRYDTIQLLLVGTVHTRLDRSVGPAASQAFISHVFLKMPMPIPDSAYPHPRVLEPGRPLTVPFNFVIPSFLTVEACKHKVTSDAVRDAHTLLPPTLGSSDGLDDMAPLMARVTYAVKARVWGEPDEHHRHGPKLLEAAREIRVIPAAPEQPPLSLSPRDKLYCLNKTKTLRRGLLGKKIGKVTARAAQPVAARLKPDGRGMVAPSKASVDLEFEPSAEGQEPPRVVGVQAKIGAYTYFSDAGMDSLPDREDGHARGRAAGFDNRGYYSTSVSLPGKTSVEGVRWTKGRAYNPMERRDSGYSSETPEDDRGARSRSADSSGSQPSRTRLLRTPERSGSPVVFTSKVDVPIVLPLDKKSFPPTFHSCTASRVYTVQVAVTLATGEGKGASTSTVSLTLPLQVAVDDATVIEDDDQGPPSFEAAVEQAEMDAYGFLRPRMMSRQEEMAALVRQTSGGLPGYGDI